MNKKAQIQHVFTYLIAIIIIGFLVIFGFKMVNNIINKQCDVSETQFSTQIKIMLDRGARYGVTRNPWLPVPCDYKELCFINTESVKKGKEIDLDKLDNNELLQSSIKDQIQYNIYLIANDKSIYPVAWDDRINISDSEGNAICIKSKAGKFSFWTKGQGKKGIQIYENPAS